MRPTDPVKLVTRHTETAAAKKESIVSYRYGAFSFLYTNIDRSVAGM